MLIEEDANHISTAPFERQVTRFMHHVLQATWMAVLDVQTSDVGLEEFISRAEEGVSANMCDALVALGGDEELAFDIEFGWSSIVPSRRSRADSVHTRVDSLLREHRVTFESGFPKRMSLFAATSFGCTENPALVEEMLRSQVPSATTTLSAT